MGFSNVRYGFPVPIFPHKFGTFRILFVGAHIVRPINAPTKQERLARSENFRQETHKNKLPKTYRKAHTGGLEGVGGLGKESAEGKPQGGKGEGDPASLLCRAPPPCPLKVVPLHTVLFISASKKRSHVK